MSTRTRKIRATSSRSITTLALLVVALSAMAAGRPDLPATRTNGIGMTLRLIPAGTFTMGARSDEVGRQPNETPVHEVTITRPFYMGAHEVTVADFTAFVDATGYVTEAERDVDGGFGIDFETGRVEQGSDVTWRDPGFTGYEQSPRDPVILVSWNDAEAFCRWLSETENATYRLPTEAEWEHAARGGTTTVYSSGDRPVSLRGAANIADASLRRAMPAGTWAETWDDGYAFTAPVGTFEANPFGLHDMHGNAWEWCSDWYDDHAYATGPVRDPKGPSVGRFRTIRGGGWFNTARRNRSAQRVYFDPTFRYCLLSGFRVVMEVPE